MEMMQPIIMRRTITSLVRWAIAVVVVLDGLVSLVESGWRWDGRDGRTGTWLSVYNLFCI